MALHAAIQVCRETDPSKNVLVILPDGGRPYLSKVFDDAWMIEHGFLERVGEGPSIAQVLRAKTTGGEEVPAFVAVGSDQRVSEAIALLQQFGISQLPVIRRQNGHNGQALDLGDLVGAIHERDLLDHVFKDHDALNVEVSTLMAPPLSIVRSTDAVDAVYRDLQERPAVVVADGVVPVGVLTRSDLLDYLARAR
jgi:cystathionine beta-synthase